MNLTRWIIIGVVGIVGLIDVILAIVYGLDGTISVQLTEWSHLYPVIPFAFGFLMGHFFAQNKS